MKKAQAFMVMILILSLLAGCKKAGEEDDSNSQYKGMTAKDLYTESQTAMSKGQYTTAIKRLEALESMYPFSDFAEKAQMDLISAYYRKEDYPSAAATAERFIHLYPRASSVDYAYYMKGLSNFQQVRGTFANILPFDESWRHPGTQTQAYTDFSTLVQRFPESQYKTNALQRLIYLRNMFAQRELNTANYYFERKMYVAAAQRANFLIKNYPQASSAEPALALLYRINKGMGLSKSAEENLAVYEASYHKKLI